MKTQQNLTERILICELMRSTKLLHDLQKLQQFQAYGQYQLMKTSAKIKEMATVITNDKFDSKTYRKLWYQDYNIAHLTYETFSQDQQRLIIENLKKQLDQSSIFYIFENRRISSCLEITKMLFTALQDTRKARLKQQQKKAEQQQALRKSRASNKILRLFSPGKIISLTSDKAKPTLQTGDSLEGEDEQDHLLQKNK